MEALNVVMSKLAHFLDYWLASGGEDVSLTHWLPLTPGRFQLPISF
jgi:hypothetical protein